MSPSCPSSPDGHYVVWHVPFLPMFPDTSEEFSPHVSQPSCELQQLLSYKNPGRLSRGAISFHTECTAGTEPSCQPILSPFPPTPNMQSTAGASLPGRQGYLGQERESQGHFPQPRCWTWISGTRISIDLEKDHIQAREVSAWLRPRPNP